jgi:MFS transporter, putative metabolite:H+ symporter
LSVFVPAPPAGATRSDAGTIDNVVARLERLPFSRFHLHVASVLGVGTFFDAYDSLAIAVALPALIAILGLNTVQAGAVVSTAFLGALLGALIGGSLSEIYGRRILFALSLIVFGVTTFALAFALTFKAMIVLRFIQGLGLGAEVPVAAAMLNEFLRGESRGRIASLYQSLFAWGTLLTPAIGYLCYEIYGQANGWRAIFIFGGLPVFAGVYALFRLPESPRWLAEKGRMREADEVIKQLEASVRGTLLDPAARVSVIPKKTQFVELFSREYAKRTILVWTQCFTSSVVVTTLGALLPTIYVRVGHTSTKFAIILTIFGSVLTVLAAYLFAVLVDRVGRKPLFVAGFVLTALGSILGISIVALLHSTAWPGMFAAMALMLIGSGMQFNGMYLYIGELFPTRMRSWATSTGQSISRLGGIVGPLLLGLLLASVLGAVGMYAMFLVVTVAGLVVMLTIGTETKLRPLEELSA